MVTAAIYGCERGVLSASEAAFFRDSDPWGFILFRRNCDDAAQIRKLCNQLRDAVGRDAPILIDHEGGRVSRLSPHIAPKRPPAEVYAKIAQKFGLKAGIEAARLGGELLARDARNLGITVNCVPMVDVRHPDADDIIGDRALGETPEQVAALGLALAEGSLAGGCLPVVKHIPGHGRSLCDSHLELPRVAAEKEHLESIDFAPFKALHHLPLAMTAHIIYTAYDADLPATLSSTVIENVIRQQIGFDGLLMTDDLSMKALCGTFRERTEASLKAGCDLVLHCNGEMPEMLPVAEGAKILSSAAHLRSERALEQLVVPPKIDKQDLNARFASLTNAVIVADGE